jgi:hypothetical protein
LIVLGVWAYLRFVADIDPFQRFAELFSTEASDSTSSAKESPAPESKSDEDLGDASLDEELESPKTEELRPISGNPYWALPNTLVGTKPLRRVWSSEDEESWRGGFSHRFSYQRLKTVQLIRRNRAFGSEAILWEALGDKKAWTRLFAAIGLAEFGVPIANKVLLRAIKGERSELVSGFFERFAKKPNPGVAYVMRQVVRLLDADGRLVCIRGLWNTRDPYRDLYMAAATLDPSPKIQKWISAQLLRQSIPLARFDHLIDVVKGKAKDTQFERLAAKAKRRSTPKLKEDEGVSPSVDPSRVGGQSEPNQAPKDQGADGAGMRLEGAEVKFYPPPTPPKTNGRGGLDLEYDP